MTMRVTRRFAVALMSAALLTAPGQAAAAAPAATGGPVIEILNGPKVIDMNKGDTCSPLKVRLSGDTSALAAVRIAERKNGSRRVHQITPPGGAPVFAPGDYTITENDGLGWPWCASFGWGDGLDTTIHPRVYVVGLDSSGHVVARASFRMKVVGLPFGGPP